ncbi:helix-turn-helix transcriptional regulator [Mycolicibacterium wolinskyi]|uniref:helix-turn-helix transcriptional regulator n=1 Tax=Mycolicibacterium wolinskyi TaxID=59750 RepID=UPI003917A7F0
MPPVSTLSMTTREVAQLTGLSESTLRWWRMQGGKQGPPSLVLGQKSVRYRRTSVMAWIAAQEEATRVGSIE